jgi:hypothetical protein
VYKAVLDVLQAQTFYFYELTGFGVYPASSYPMSNASSGGQTAEA